MVKDMYKLWKLFLLSYSNHHLGLKSRPDRFYSWIYNDSEDTKARYVQVLLDNSVETIFE
jgi:hypothetical protein